MSADPQLVKWLETTLARYEPDLVAVLQKNSAEAQWPLVANGPDDLVSQLTRRGHLLPLPKEPAALANVLEVSLIDFIIEAASSDPGVQTQRGTERGYPDLELTGSSFGGGYHALDVKIARRNKSGKGTKSRISLYTGNTYFRYPSIRWPGSFRPFEDYESHLDLIGIYTLDESSLGRIADLELLVREPWRIASMKRSSTTREYIGAVQRLDDLRAGNGDFRTEADFYTYWRKFKFKIGPTVQQQLDKALAAQKTGAA
jgi:hypothetical protein